MNIKRRDFIRISGSLAALSGIAPWSAYGLSRDASEEEVQSFLLKGFEDEQEEYPSMVSSAAAGTWMFSLRRMSYPDDQEHISAFKYEDGTWTEADPVSTKPGKYEAPTSSCAPDGLPFVAWTSIESGRWAIRVSHHDGRSFTKAKGFMPGAGKFINPVLCTPRAGRAILAWEKYHQGRLSICLSTLDDGSWSEPVEISKGQESCFDPALAEDRQGHLFLAYGLTDGLHQNIEMVKLHAQSLAIEDTIPVAIGGGFEKRINLNTQAAMAFDSRDRLWISYENNRHAHRLDDSDCFTGDRYCAMLCYHQGELRKPQGQGKWLFSGKNDHRPTFFKDREGHLFVASHCGGDFTGNPYWQNRISYLDEERGWAKPVSVHQSSQKGVLIPPAFGFDPQNKLWMATLNEAEFTHEHPEEHGGAVRSRVTQLQALQIPMPVDGLPETSLVFQPTQVEEHHPGKDYIPEVSGRPKLTGQAMEVGGQSYRLLVGNLHEHSENSPCWPAGTDGTLHDDYRFALFSENYDFLSITDHGYSQTELYWRKNMRMADFYNDPPYFVALPGMEWTLTARGDLESVPGAGHYNVIFSSEKEARNFIRNAKEIYNVNSPETSDPSKLWSLLHEKEIDCITIPHHPADKSHPVDWHMHDPHFVPVVELFQCRGNAEYPGCPREFNLDRHTTTPSKRAFVDYALRDMKYKMGFVASGDHNGLGVGNASLWVKDVSREGILEAMRARRCFGTTGDKIVMRFFLNNASQGSTVKSARAPELDMEVRGQRELEKVEVLRNSRVIREYLLEDDSEHFQMKLTDPDYAEDKGVLYYYIRATQKNGELAWSSPVWVEQG